MWIEEGDPSSETWTDAKEFGNILSSISDSYNPMAWNEDALTLEKHRFKGLQWNKFFAFRR